MKVRLIKDVDTTGGQMPAGTIIDHHDAGMLVLLGTAEHVTDAPPDNQASAVDDMPGRETYAMGQA